MLKGLHHIGVKCKDVQRSKAFYTTIGMTCERTAALENGTKLAFMQAGSCVIELIQPADGQLPAQKGMVAHIAFAVQGIDAVVDKLHALGIETDTPEAGHIPLFTAGCRNIFFAGPDGEELELFEEL